MRDRQLAGHRKDSSFLPATASVATAAEIEPAGEESDEDEELDVDDLPESAEPTPLIPDEARVFDEDHVYEKRHDDTGNTVMVIVDTSGVHHLPVKWCRCPGHAKDHLQAFDLGFFPASFKRIRTVFTFAVLDDYLADNQECNTSKYHYIQKLRRFTSSSFPHTVPVT